MDLKIISDGSPVGTRILNAISGEDVTERIGANAIHWTMRSGQPPVLAIDLHTPCELKAGGAVRFRVVNYHTGQWEDVRAIEFATGERLEMPE